MEARANAPVKNMAVVLGFRDDNQYEVFDTSTQRLGRPPVNLEAGEVYRVTFELDPGRANLAELRAEVRSKGKPWAETWLYLVLKPWYLVPALK